MDVVLSEEQEARRRGHVVQARLKANRVSAASNGFAVRIEDHKLDVVEAVLADEPCQLHAKSLNGHARCNLTEVASRI